MNYELNSKKILFVFCALIALTILVFGASYAFLSVRTAGKKDTSVKTGSVTLHYNEHELTKVNLINALPMNDTNGVKTDYFEFDITADTTNFEVPYVVTSRIITQEENRIPLSYITVYLTEVNGTEETQVLKTTYDQLTNVTANGHSEQQLLSISVPEDTTNYSKTYRLRMWVNETANYSATKDENNNLTYPMENKELRVTVNVYSSVEPDNNNQNTYGPGLYTMDDVLVEDWDSLVDNRGLTLDLSNGIQVVDASLNENGIDIGKLVISTDVTEITYNAFKNYSKLGAVVIPSSVQIIRGNAFSYSGLQYAIIEAKRIDMDAFKNNNNLKSVDIKGTTEIISSAFDYNPVLDTVSLVGGDSLFISSNSFGHCDSLKEIEISGNNITLQSYSFYNTQLEKLVLNGTGNKINATAINKDYIKELELHGTYIDPDAFNNSQSLTKVALYDCDLDINLGGSQFYNCKNLTDLYIDGGTIGNSSFYGCIGLTELTSDNFKNVTAMGPNAFQECKGLTHVEIPETLTYLPEMTFDNCTNLTTVELNNITSIGQQAFRKCTSLASVTIPASVTTIGDNAFINCSNLNTVVFEDGVTTIGSFMFDSCSSLENITIPSSVNQIGSYAFSGTAWLTNKRNENPLVVVNNILIDGYKATGSVVVPEGVTKIGSGAFANSTLTSLKLPSTLNTIEKNIIFNANNLSSVTFTGTSDWNVGSNVVTSADLSNPTNAKNLLKTTYAYYVWQKAS